GALDHDFRDCCELQFLFHVIANLEIAMEKRRHFLGRGVPLRTPVTVHRETKADWVNFLSHKLFLHLFIRRRRLFRLRVRLSLGFFLGSWLALSFSPRLLRFFLLPLFLVPGLDLDLVGQNDSDMAAAL